MAQSNSKTDNAKQKVEQMGVFFENAGFSPMHGRVLAYLLLSEPPYRDFYEIQEFLKASKSAISNALKFLSNEEIVNYITFSGDRRRYFQVNIKGWLKNYKARIRSVSTLRDLVQEVLEERSTSKHLDFNEKLESMIDFQTHLADGIEELINSWEAKRE